MSDDQQEQQEQQAAAPTPMTAANAASPAPDAAGATTTATNGGVTNPSKGVEKQGQKQNQGGGKKKKKGGGGGGGGKPKTPAAPEREWTADLQADFDRMVSVGEECIFESELRSLILAKGRGSGVVPAKGGEESGSAAADAPPVPPPPRIRFYDGFEPSGRMHIAQGVFKSVNVNKCTVSHPTGEDASADMNTTFCFWVADWFALMNDKMGGDLAKIRTVGAYLIQVWTAAGMDLTNVEFRWASDDITGRASEYWPLMLDVARRFNVTRIKKCCQSMGRLEGNLTAAQVLYPLMQCTDVFFLKADICQLGVDQRKVNVLAREYCDAAKRKRKPVILSHHMLYGLKAGQEKMSKSDADSAIFMEDSRDDVERKIMDAYCPSKAEETKAGGEDAAEVAEGLERLTTEDAGADAGKESMHLTKDDLKNPCLDYVQNIVLSPPDSTFAVPDGKTYDNFAEVRSDFVGGVISEQGLKRGLIDALNALLQPVRDHFENDPVAKKLLEDVKRFKKETATGGGGGGDEKSKKVPRCDLAASGKVPKACHLVVAPLPTSSPPLQAAADILARLSAGGGGDGAPKVLYLPDWSATVCNAVEADAKVISAYYAVLLAAVRALDDRGAPDGAERVMSNVTVLRQSDAILSDPSGYWIAVINAGRHFSLDDAMGIAGGGDDGRPGAMKDSDGVGKVISRLMTVSDVLAVNPASVAFAGGDGTGDGDAAVESALLRRFWEEKIRGTELDVGGDGPAALFASAPSLGLQPPRETDAHRTENDEYFLADDPKVHGKSKMKKAFCEPGNVDFCPPIEILTHFGGLSNGSGGGEGGGATTVKRSAENGGDATYRTRDELVKDFASGALHPGDLKATASAVMADVLTKIGEAVKADPDAAKGIKALKAFEKKMAKQKKK